MPSLFMSRLADFGREAGKAGSQRGAPLDPQGCGRCLGRDGTSALIAYDRGLTAISVVLVGHRGGQTKGGSHPTVRSGPSKRTDASLMGYMRFSCASPPRPPAA
jgi:hypothetical protein